MSLPAVYLPEARNDIDEAYADNESQLAGLGARFVTALQHQVVRIQDHPALYGTVYRDVRAASVRRFPYVIYYRIETSRILILAVQHGSRDWSHWQFRK